MSYDKGYVNYGYKPEMPSIPGEYNQVAMPTGTVTVGGQKPKLQLTASVILHESTEDKSDRDKWGKDIEFLLSCISLSVGLGNVWRFPFTALENGGGAFLIPYLIVLFLVGKPVYYMEMLIGQFSSRGGVKVFDLCPMMRGVGYGQVFSTGLVMTYYASIMALTIRYFIASFSTILPWSYCREEWNATCVDSSSNILENSTEARSTSAELYFLKEVLREKDTIHDGLGAPNWELVLCLGFSWCVIALILIKGIRSSGKASYVLAIFPYIIMFVLLIRAVTLPGASDGIIYFVKPQWDQLLNPKVWYAAVTQVFFSLAICFGNIIMYASYNRFPHNVLRDATIITSLDTMTSLLAGFIIFGILGNLAYETKADSIAAVVQGGSGLAFVSYPDAIAKFTFAPQVFAVLFFLMLFILGIGSNVGMASCVMTVIRDKFSHFKHYWVGLGISVSGFLIGLMFVTPGGQYMLNFVDYFGASFVALVLAIFELITIGWIYGVKRLCKDIDFMLDITTGYYYRLCWAIITPCLMGAILIYSLVELKPLQYKDYIYPDYCYAIGWCLAAFGILQLPFWAIYAVMKQPENTLSERIVSAFKPKKTWGPSDPSLLEKYKKFMTEESSGIFKRTGLWYRIYDNIFG